jgi:cytochrome c oxidase cbb3-type subunit 3
MMTRWIAAAALLAGIWTGWAATRLPAMAQVVPKQGAPPFDLADPAVIDEGARLFRQTCTGYCHGKDGGAARAPKLRAKKLERSYVYGRIVGGSPNGMPAFGPVLSQEKIWELVAYVVSISNAEDK